MNELHEECGIFGICSPEITSVAHDTYLAMYALQHRGQQSCGIVVNDSGVLTSHKANGLIPDVFDHETLDNLGNGQMAIGHVRYASDAANKSTDSAQPLVVRHVKGPMALAYNGCLVNSLALKESFELDGAIFQTTNDSEVIAYAITKSRLITGSIETAVEKAMDMLKGAYSLLVMSPQKLIAARDPNGFRPLCMGVTSDGAYVFASESCAFDSIGAEFLRDIKPGEIVVVSNGNVKSINTHCGKKTSFCAFEYIYFARPDSIINGCSVHEFRQHAGERLAEIHPIDADVVIGVPDSGIDAAIGYSKRSEIKYGIGFIKNRYVGRTFIQSSQGKRDDAVKIKLNVVKDTVYGKRVVLIDDSIVRGTTCARIVKLLKEAGAKQVHIRVTCPAFLNPCYFGTDISSREHLIACRMTTDEICRHIGADSLGYLDVESLKAIASGSDCELCDACFTDSYPMDISQALKKDKFNYKLGTKQV